MNFTWTGGLWNSSVVPAFDYLVYTHVKAIEKGRCLNRRFIIYLECTGTVPMSNGHLHER